jgi:hypothetical protein
MEIAMSHVGTHIADIRSTASGTQNVPFYGMESTKTISRIVGEWSGLLFAGEGNGVGGTLAMAEVGPRLGDMILIYEGNEEFDHVEFIGCVQAVYVLHGEIVFTRGVVQLTGSENRLVAGGTEMNGDDVIAIEAVHCDHARVARRLKPFHHDATGKDLVAHADRVAATVFAFPITSERFELLEGGIRTGFGMCWVSLAMR